MDAKVDCSFDELSYNVLHNRILKSTIRALMSTEDVDKTIRDELSLSYRKLEAIEEIELRKNLFRRLQFSRNNFFYDFLMKICELITDNLLIDEEGKENKFRDFLQNEKAMAYLFEAFVGNFYRKHKSDHGFKVRTQKKIDWVGEPLDKTSEDYLPKMQADVILESSDKKIVLDTKYYKETLQEYHGKKTIHSENLYQIFSYIKNLEVLGGLNETCEGILLYPTIDASFPGADYEIQGHRVSVRTVNLNQDWRGIHEELIRVIH
jgi:5-methylcytosine-specific restriction enzyme subunit McrC